MEHFSTDLLTEIKRGNQLAFKKLYDEYQHKIYAYALRYLKSKALAEELVQEVFLKVWNHRGKLDIDKNIAAYLYKIAQNTIYQQLKVAARDKELRATLFFQDSDQQPDVLEADLFHKELLQVYAEAVNLLPTQRKKVFQMSRNDDLSHEEIAQLLDISKNTVKDQVVKASRFIRKYILINQ